MTVLPKDLEICSKVLVKLHAKVRDGEKRYVKIKDRINMKNFKQTRALIVDDLVQTGGTLFECLLTLREDGFTQISAYVTHPIFPNDSYIDFLEGGSKSGFHRFYVTDSVPEVAYNLPSPLFQVISLVPDISLFLSQMTDGSSMINDNSVVILRVASKSKVKMAAVNKAVKMLYPDYEEELGKFTSPKMDRMILVQGNDTKSCVNEQPMNDEINKGCYNRYSYLKNSKTKDTDYKILRGDGSEPPLSVQRILISIESGIICKEDKYYDTACVMIGNHQQIEVEVWSDCVEVSKDLS